MRRFLFLTASHLKQTLLIKRYTEAQRNLLRAGSRDDLEYQKLLINTLIDRIYLYDDHFSIYLNHSGRKGKVSDLEAADIEQYFDSSPDNSGSLTGKSCTPIKIDRPSGLSIFIVSTEGVRSSEGGSDSGV
jgi:hypothetical protein